jgi:hypothetical protein
MKTRRGFQSDHSLIPILYRIHENRKPHGLMSGGAEQQMADTRTSSYSQRKFSLFLQFGTWVQLGAILHDLGKVIVGIRLLA